MGKVAAMVAPESGMVLDVACGPGTLGRRIASSTRTVYGIDISWSMLRQGVAYVTQEGIGNVEFARASADALPFPDAFFNVARAVAHSICFQTPSPSCARLPA